MIAGIPMGHVGGPCVALGTLSAILACALKCVKQEQPNLPAPLQASSPVPDSPLSSSNFQPPISLKEDPLPTELWVSTLANLDDHTLFNFALSGKGHAELIKMHFSKRLLRYQLREEAFSLWEKNVVQDPTRFSFITPKLTPFLDTYHLPRIFDVIDRLISSAHNKQDSEIIYYNLVCLYSILPKSTESKARYYVKKATEVAFRQKIDQLILDSLAMSLEFDLINAHEFIENIQEDINKDRAWGMIAVKLAQHDYIEALKAASHIKNSAECNKAIGNIIKDAYLNLSENLDKIVYVYSQQRSDLVVLQHLAMGYHALGDNEKVIELLDYMSDTAQVKAILLSNLAKKCNPVDIQDADFLKKLFVRATRLKAKDWLIPFAAVFCMVDSQKGSTLLEQAIAKYAQNPQDSNSIFWIDFRNEILTFEKAVEIVQKISVAIRQAVMWLALAKRTQDTSLACNFLEEAYRLTPNKGNLFHDELLLGCLIAKVYALHNKDRAAEILGELEPKLRESNFVSLNERSLIGVYARLDFRKGLFLVETELTDLAFKTKGYLTLAKTVKYLRHNKDTI
jgi:hypothetical protein